MFMRHFLKRKETGSGALAEFAPVLFVFFLFILFPLINLVGFGAGNATVQFATRHAATACATAVTYPGALSTMQTEINRVASSGFGKFAKLKANGGYNNCGADLYLVVTDVNTNVVKTYGPNTPPPNATQSSSELYEYRVQTRFDVSPWLNMSGIPFIGNVPVIGKTVTIVATCDRNAEHPEGFASAPAQTGGPTTTGSTTTSALVSGPGGPITVSGVP